MPNRAIVLPDLPNITHEEIAHCISTWLADDERSHAWLAKRIGVADTRTLKSWLEERPDLLPVKAWLLSVKALRRSGHDIQATVADLRAKAAA